MFILTREIGEIRQFGAPDLSDLKRAAVPVQGPDHPLASLNTGPVIDLNWNHCVEVPHPAATACGRLLDVVLLRRPSVSVLSSPFFSFLLVPLLPRLLFACLCPASRCPRRLESNSLDARPRNPLLCLQSLALLQLSRLDSGSSRPLRDTVCVFPYSRPLHRVWARVFAVADSSCRPSVGPQSIHSSLLFSFVRRQETQHTSPASPCAIRFLTLLRPLPFSPCTIRSSDRPAPWRLTRQAEATHRSQPTPRITVAPPTPSGS
ncbi:hypothetical protein THAR02_07666 [Trichoderma harzianum]|uniref:Uncharacterized protein n=1 Tax=Trichoderma harzianum TaxID=5544 RepID=A0A0F9X4U6_TRIHA|nr:hypothetical protein THAR02_07666 [Trichoderma harzianum]